MVTGSCWTLDLDEGLGEMRKTRVLNGAAEMRRLQLLRKEQFRPAKHWNRQVLGEGELARGGEKGRENLEEAGPW